MKKVLSLLFATLLFISVQAQLSRETETANPSRDVPECMANSVFSQLPVYDNGYTADDLTGYTVADDYTASAPFSVVRLFGGNYAGGPINPSETFTVEIYNGPPNAGGVVVHSFSKTVVPVSLGIVFNGTERYMVDIELGQTVALLNGWINVYREAVDNTYRFSWLAGYDPQFGNAIQYNISTQIWSDTSSSMQFCLGNFEPMPISNLAIILGLGLIMAFVIFRYRWHS